LAVTVASAFTGLAAGLIATIKAQRVFCINESPITKYRNTRRDPGKKISLHFDHHIAELREQATHLTSVHVEETFRVLKHLLNNTAPGQRFSGIKAIVSSSPVFLKLEDNGQPRIRDNYRILIERLSPEVEIKRMRPWTTLAHLVSLRKGWKQPQRKFECHMRWNIAATSEREELLKRASAIVDAFELIDSLQMLSARERTDMKGDYVHKGFPNLRSFLREKDVL